MDSRSVERYRFTSIECTKRLLWILRRIARIQGRMLGHRRVAFVFNGAAAQRGGYQLAAVPICFAGLYTSSIHERDARSCPLLNYLDVTNEIELTVESAVSNVCLSFRRIRKPAATMISEPRCILAIPLKIRIRWASHLEFLAYKEMAAQKYRIQFYSLDSKLYQSSSISE